VEDPFEGRDREFLQSPLVYPSRSPSPQARQRQSALAFNEEVFLEDDIDLAALKHNEQILKDKERTDQNQRAQVLEILDDLPEADIEPPKNVLFVCKLNPVTQSDDLELIFSRFGKVKSAEVIRDWKTNDSL
jgi:peptidyl-prolyl cis-trans isomerase-like 4